MRLKFWLFLSVLFLFSFVCTSVNTVAESEPSTTAEPMTCGKFNYILRSDGTALLTRHCGDETSVTVPTELDGIAVTAIGDNAFSQSVSSVTIPDCVVDLIGNPFLECKRPSIYVSLNHPTLTYIDGILFDKSNKSLLFFPSKSPIEEYTIPEGIRIIGDRAFSYCYNLTTITIPDSVEKIGINPFEECTSQNRVKVSSKNPSIKIDKTV